MAPLSFTNELESQLKKVGKKLSKPPRSNRKILHTLDKAEDLLSEVGQTPSASMLEALFLFMAALISNALLRHPDMDVKVSVASCISEIIRITAPKEPYADEIMKEIFELNVMAFGQLSHGSGRCYSKALHILKTNAQAQSFFLMMDLECEDLIAEMFQQFLSTIRSDHPHDVFTDMENIMTKIIEESKEVSNKLLTLLLLSVSKENKNVSPISWKLGEKVLRNCAGKLKVCLPVLMQSLSLDPDNYAEVVASICQDAQKMEAEGLMMEIHTPGENNPSAEKSSLPSRETHTRRKIIPNKRLQGYVIGEETEIEAQNRKKKQEDLKMLPKPVSPPATTSTKRGGDNSTEASKKKASPKDKEQNADPPCLPVPDQEELGHLTEVTKETKAKGGKKRQRSAKE